MPAEELAPALVGMVLVRVLESGERLSGRIVETEAYLGVKDRAAHSYGGRRTARNEAMYARAGTAYVYFTYGMHFCVNVVCGREDEPVAVLLRALEPLEGLEAMARNRAAARRASTSKLRGRVGGESRAEVTERAETPVHSLGAELGQAARAVSVSGRPAAALDRVYTPADLCSGPGKLCSALQIGRELNASDLCEGEYLWLEAGEPVAAARLGSSARIGIDSAGAWAKRKLRWFEKQNPCVSR